MRFKFSFTILFLFCFFPFAATPDVLDVFELDAVSGSPDEIKIERIICDEASRIWFQGESVTVEVPPLGNVSFPGAAPMKAQGLLHESESLRFDDGLPVAITRIRGASMVEQVKLQYSEDNQRSGLLKYGPEGALERKETYTYDENGRKAMWTTFDGEENWIERHHYFYNENGEIIKENRHFSRPPREENIQYRYEEGGSIVWMEHFDAEGNFLVKHFRMYDELGRFLGETYFDKSGEESGNIFIVRNREGHEIDRRIITPRGGQEYRGEFKVNEKGLRTETKETGIKGRLMKHEWHSYIYDDIGNWTVRVDYSMLTQRERRVFVPVSVDRRTIQYSQEPAAE